ncbi:MAG: hypothetical protein JWM62_2413 [Frankiales bacterium]|nr:hypothetical protein [Frankiales bacterium]
MSASTPEDRQEQRSSPSGDAPVHPAPDVPLEATDADVLEQAAATGPGQHVADSGGDAGVLPLEANPADAYEQAVVVELDEDERR